MDLRVFAGRGAAERVAREEIVGREGAGFVLKLEVRREFFADGAVPGDGLVVAAGDVAELNTQLAGTIVEAVDFRGAVDDAEFAGGPSLPAEWRAYLQSPSWFRRGLLASGKYVWLYPPAEGREILAIWEAEERFPGIALIGGDGGLENFVFDLRQDPAPVLMVSNASESWADAVVQAPDAADFIKRLEDGTFDLAVG
ncbi:hypothetical protein ACGFJ7_14925 [Actinoplanes sp. NPDC048988]|uniref:hypothetical protein n=1 Tax=Actinoplanes sp. NPDC048988 TaxID=3363901 RepID=UPI003721913E